MRKDPIPPALIAVSRALERRLRERLKLIETEIACQDCVKVTLPFIRP